MQATICCGGWCCIGDMVGAVMACGDHMAKGLPVGAVGDAQRPPSELALGNGGTIGKPIGNIGEPMGETIAACIGDAVGEDARPKPKPLQADSLHAEGDAVGLRRASARPAPPRNASADGRSMPLRWYSCATASCASSSWPARWKSLAKMLWVIADGRSPVANISSKRPTPTLTSPAFTQPSIKVLYTSSSQRSPRDLMFPRTCMALSSCPAWQYPFNSVEKVMRSGLTEPPGVNISCSSPSAACKSPHFTQASRIELYVIVL
mmetsp:Transcript_36061/g.103735  ORF Transcript_36061/g.103735 Transcript_36061/m.103735 type:complete len:263 (+) Transcript_36061:846-1634(+)